MKTDCIEDTPSLLKTETCQVCGCLELADGELGKPCNMNSMKETLIKTHRKFDPTFKRQAVQHSLASGKSAEIIAQELGILAKRLYDWRKCFA